MIAPMPFALHQRPRLGEPLQPLGRPIGGGSGIGGSAVRGRGDDALERQRHRRRERARADCRKLRRVGCMHRSPSRSRSLLHGSAQSASRRAPMFNSTSHDGVKRPGTREMTAHARRADGAQRLRDRRDDPGAAGDRPVASRRSTKTTGSWSSSPISSASPRPSCCGARSPTASGASRSSPSGVALYGAVRPAVRASPAASRC